MRWQSKDFEVSVPINDLALELNFDRLLLDRHLNALKGKGIVEIPSTNHYVRLTPYGKDEWDKKLGKQYYLLIRQQILERVKQVDDNESSGLTTSEALASDLGVELNTIFINLLALEGNGWVKIQRMLAGNVPVAYISLTVCRGSSATCRLKSGAGNYRFTPLAKIRF